MHVFGTGSRRRGTSSEPETTEGPYEGPETGTVLPALSLPRDSLGVTFSPEAPPSTLGIITFPLKQ